MYECNICHQFARKTFAAILRHIGEVHRHFQGAVKCGVEGCPHTPTSYEGLRRHLHRQHKWILTGETNSVQEQMEEEPPSDSEFDQRLCLESDEDDGDADTTATADRSPWNESIPRLAAQFILKTREGKRLTQTAVDSIVGDITDMVSKVVNSIQRKVLAQLKSLGVVLTAEQQSGLREAFSGPETNPFQGLETQYKQEKFFREHFNYVVSFNT